MLYPLYLSSLSFVITILNITRYPELIGLPKYANFGALSARKSRHFTCLLALICLYPFTSNLKIRPTPCTRIKQNIWGKKHVTLKQKKIYKEISEGGQHLSLFSLIVTMTAPHTVQASLADTHSLREIMSVGQQSHTQRINRISKSVQSFFARDGPLRRDYEDFAIFSKEASLMFAYIFAGWNDATAGSLLPAIQKQYNLSFALVSMLFVANLIGWIAAAIVTPKVLKRFTVGRSFTIATAVAIIPAAVIAAGSPFPAMVIMYALFGLSIGTMEALANAWIAARPNKRVRLSCLHFAYGLGALCAPLAGSPFVVAGLDFHHFYFASLGLCVLNTLFITASFKLRKEGYPGEKEDDQTVPQRQGITRTGSEEQIELQTLSARQQTTNDAITPQTEIEVDECASEKNSQIASQRRRSSAATVQSVPTPVQRQESASPWKTVLRQKDTHIFAIFCLFYVGTEVSIGGWTSTYIIQVRDDLGSSGHIVSGFWAGLAAGRVMLLPITDFFGAQLAALIYLSLSIALQLVVWFVPNVIANAVAVAMMGMLLGPLFPIMIELISLRIIPRSVQTSAIAYIVSFGSAGSALFPLIFGLMIQKFGPRILPPLLVATLSIQTLIFLGLGIPKRGSNTGEAQRSLE